MQIASKPENERQRLAALRTYNILDTPAEKEYDEIVALASAICETPISTITLIDESRQWHKARVGLSDHESTRDLAFCAHAILKDEMMVVSDTTLDDRFTDHPSVPEIRFYAGMPLINPEGFKLGTLCVIDQQPKKLTELQQFALKVLAKQVSKQMELRRNMDELQRMNQLNNRLLSLIGHDLRSPMASLHGLLELENKHNLSQAEFKEFVGSVRSGLNSSMDLLSNLLAWANAQFSTSALREEPFYMSVLAQEIIQSHQTDFAKKKNTAVNEIEKDTIVVADQNMMRAVLRNLVLNANKFTQAGTIRLTSRTAGAMVEIGITDTGIGITDQQAQKIFSWSDRMSVVGTAGEKGSGFGLMVCKDFVERNNGKIWMTSTLGEGSSFYFSLPAS